MPSCRIEPKAAIFNVADSGAFGFFCLVNHIQNPCQRIYWKRFIFGKLHNAKENTRSSLFPQERWLRRFRPDKCSVSAVSGAGSGLVLGGSGRFLEVVEVPVRFLVPEVDVAVLEIPVRVPVWFRTFRVVVPAWWFQRFWCAGSGVGSAVGSGMVPDDSGDFGFWLRLRGGSGLFRRFQRELRCGGFGAWDGVHWLL